jgi:hypothetical protein
VYGAGIGGQQKHRHQYAKKKQALLDTGKPYRYTLAASGSLEVRLEVFCEAEMDEQRSYVGRKAEQRWLWWYAIDHLTGTDTGVCLW